jgi:hypothetical protein
VIADDLTAESNAGQAARGEYCFFRGGHLARFTRYELDAARRATRVAAAGMQLIDLGYIG